MRQKMCSKCRRRPWASLTVSYCKPCYAKYMDQYRKRRLDPNHVCRRNLSSLTPEERKEIARATARKHYNDNKESCRKKSLDYYYNHHTRLLSYGRTYYKAHKDRFKELSRQYYELHKDELNAKAKERRRQAKIMREMSKV